MAKRIRICPRCMGLVGKNDVECPSCGLEVEKMQEMIDKEKEARNKNSKEEERADESEVLTREDGGIKIDTAKVMEQNEQKEEKARQDAKDVARKVTENEIGTVVFEEQQTETKRHKHRPRKQSERPEYTIDKNGEYNIDTRDVSYLEGASYSAKKARGDYQPEKLKWWEIYKWADRMLAKRKIMKEVNKASHKPPVGVSRTTATILCVLFGWMGGHNFYTKNLVRAWVSLISITISILVISIPQLAPVRISLGGGFGFVAVAIWLYDIVALIWGFYRYRISKLEFISKLDIETRAKIGKKYINFDHNAFVAKDKKRMDKINRKLEKKQERQNDRLKKQK